MNRNNILLAFTKRFGKTKKLKSPIQSEFDEKLLLWIEEIRASESIPLTTKMLIQKANIIAKEPKIDSSFQCSESWIQRFKKRYSICKGRIVGEAKEADVSVSTNWLKDTWEHIRSGYADRDIFNADETGLFYKYMPNSTL